MCSIKQVEIMMKKPRIIYFCYFVSHHYQDLPAFTKFAMSPMGYHCFKFAISLKCCDEMDNRKLLKEDRLIMKKMFVMEVIMALQMVVVDL